MTASAQAFHAIRAAKHRRQWGEYAAERYAERRGVTFSMYMIAVRVETERANRVQRRTV